MVNKKSILFLFVVFSLIFSSCHVARFFYWNFADINDYKRFPSVAVHTSSPNFYFSHLHKQLELKLPENTKNSKPNQSLDQYLSDNHTVAFLVIRRDTILYERYFDEYDSTSIYPSFSVSKSVISALVGIAIGEGKIKSVEQPVTDYLKNLKDPDFSKVKIEDVLNMRSGIKFEESYGSPFALMPKYYYGTNLKRYASNLKIQQLPDQVYNYQSANTLLLSLILEQATGVTVNEYLSQKLWQPMGMEADASWSIDSKKNKTIKSFCCLNARVHDFARFGRLYLNKGNWNGKQLIPEGWVKKTLTITEDSRDSGGYPYQYQWRVTPEGQMFAKGVLGQYIFLDTKKDIIIVRLGKTTGKAVWPSLFKDIISIL